MAVLKYKDPADNLWKIISTVGHSDAPSDLEVTDDNLHLINAAGTKLGNGVETDNIAGEVKVVQ